MNRLFVDALKSVGLVSAGDDPEATVTFWKSADAPEMLPDESGGTKVSPSGETASDEQGFDVDLSAIEDADLRKSIEDAVAEKDSQLEELTAKVAELTPDPDPVEKADDEVKALIEKERAERVELQKQLDAEVAKRRTVEYIEKAKPLAALLGKAEDVGPVLADLATKAPESYEKLEGWLTAGTQRKELAKLFSEMGGPAGEAEADPIAQRDSFVKKYVTENPDKSEAEARAAFWKAHPEAKEELRS